MPSSSPIPPTKTHADVEVTRLFTDHGRFGLALVALALRKGLFGVVALSLCGVVKVLIEHLP